MNSVFLFLTIDVFDINVDIDNFRVVNPYSAIGSHVFIHLRKKFKVVNPQG